MSTLQQKIAADVRMRDLLAEAGLPEPDEIEYGESCIRLIWHSQKTAVVIDLEPGAEDSSEADEAA